MSALNLKHITKAVYLVRMTHGRRKGGNQPYYSPAVETKRDEDLLMAAYDLVKDRIGPNGGFRMRVDGKVSYREFFGYARPEREPDADENDLGNELLGSLLSMPARLRDLAHELAEVRGGRRHVTDLRLSDEDLLHDAADALTRVDVA